MVNPAASNHNVEETLDDLHQWNLHIPAGKSIGILNGDARYVIA